MKRPNSKVHLDAAIQRLAGTKTHDARYTEMRNIVANVVIGQLLPDCVVKGGTSLKLRYGVEMTRFTVDFDTASKMSIDAFISEMRENLAHGWNGFTGTMSIERPASPKGVPLEYVMQPFSVHLNYNGKAWCSVRLELSHNEIGDADETDLRPIAADIAQIFTELGFDMPDDIAFMPLKFQVAQKIHGLSAPGSLRIRDLIDLQLIMRYSPIPLADARAVCERLFAYRQCHQWPPRVEKGRDWDEQYTAQKHSLPVLPTVDEAIDWINLLIDRIVRA